MGLYKLLNKENELSSKSAFILAFLSIIWANGCLNKENMSVAKKIRDTISSKKQWNSAVRVWKNKTIDECVKIVTDNLDIKQQTILLANLIDIAMSDGTINAKKIIILDKYIESLDVEHDRVVNMIDSIVAKNSLCCI
jgi:uncharacterized tellurite resistance protein B-like protein